MIKGQDPVLSGLQGEGEKSCWLLSSCQPCICGRPCEVLFICFDTHSGQAQASITFLLVCDLITQSLREVRNKPVPNSLVVAYVNARLASGMATAMSPVG